MSENKTETRLKIMGRVAFPNLFEPYSGDNGAGNFGCKLVSISDEDVAKIKKVAAVVMKDKWNGKITSVKQLAQFLLHDGEDKAQYAGFEEGKMYLSLNSKTRPPVVDRKGLPITKESGIIYSGCWVMCYIDVWAQDNKNGKGINGSLVGVQFVKDDTPFAGGKPMSLDDFEALDDETGDDMDDLL